ncbi:MAG: 16S rRNA (guanine(966)-N(2))-methyltransferase RsmD [Bdellovibrionota bacterium]
MLRLTGGEFRGRLIKTPPNLKTRPTQARLRQALFNSIQTFVGESRVLDLFSGSGALGFEALSRGALEVVFIEDSRQAITLILENARSLGVSDRIKLITESVDQAWETLAKMGPFDVVLADPPYSAHWEKRLLGEAPWQRLLAPDGLFCLEWGRVKSKEEVMPDELPFLVKVREKIYGDSVLTTYRKKSEAG